MLRILVVFVIIACLITGIVLLATQASINPTTDAQRKKKKSMFDAGLALTIIGVVIAFYALYQYIVKGGRVAQVRNVFRREPPPEVRRLAQSVFFKTSDPDPRSYFDGDCDQLAMELANNNLPYEGSPYRYLSGTQEKRAFCENMAKEYIR